MIISHRHRYVFVEVPHTASTAISELLRSRYDGERILHKHATYSEFLAAANRQEKRYFAFGVVRNPLSYVETEFQRFLVDQHDFANPGKHVRKGGWVTDGHLEKLRFVRDRGTDFVGYLQRFYVRQYHNWFLLLADDFGRVLRYENLQEELRGVFAALGLADATMPERRNVTRDKANWLAELDHAECLRLARVFGPFLRKWGYPLEMGGRTYEPSRIDCLKFAAKERAVGLLARAAPLRPGRSLAAALRGRFQPRRPKPLAGESQGLP
jgi:hypothetical protein